MSINGKKTGGRKKGVPNKSTRKIKELAQQHATKALGRLIYLVEHGSNEAIQASAANSLLDRGYGKAMQQTQALNPEGQVKEEISNLELARWVAHLLTKGVKSDEEKPTSH
jgi:hypothetical protein